VAAAKTSLGLNRLTVSTTLDCELFRDVFGSSEMRRRFDTKAMVQGWLDAEAALAAAEAEVGVIPTPAAERILREANADLFDLDQLRAGIADSQHPLVPVIRALVDRCGEHGSWVHWGATTQDIMDTGMVLQVRAALPWLLEQVRTTRSACRALARRFADAPMAARTHGQQAVPMTFGFKAAGWEDELGRAESRLIAASETISVAQLGGAGGTLASLGASAEPVLRKFCARLGLRENQVPWFTARDRVRDLGHAIDQLAAAAERIAAEIIRLQATEVAEVAEGFSDGHVGSSTMPQKRNPMMCEYLVASARLVHSSVAALSSASAHAGERDMALWAVEWLAIPQTFILGGGVAEKLAALLAGLEVDELRMRANLELTDGAILAEAAMMLVATVLGHEQAHGVVMAASRRARYARRPMLEVVAQAPELGGLIAADQLQRLQDPTRYTGWSAQRAREIGRHDGSRDDKEIE
jgi:3-carboxy-cis,cis-muconate cycloisomerase